MQAPTEDISNTPEKSGGRVGRLRLSPQTCLALALLVLAATTYAAVTQPPHPDAYRLTSVFKGDWWGYPFEWNPPGRLAAVGRDLRDIYAVPGTDTVYAVGDLGTVLVSTDGGKTWESARTRAPLPTPTPSASPSASPGANVNANVNANAVNVNASNANIENTNAGNTNAGNTNTGNTNPRNTNAGNANRGVNTNANRGGNGGNTNGGDTNGGGSPNTNNHNVKLNGGANPDAGMFQALLNVLDPVPTASAAALDTRAARGTGDRRQGAVPRATSTPYPTPVPTSTRPPSNSNRGRRTVPSNSNSNLNSNSNSNYDPNSNSNIGGAGQVSGTRPTPTPTPTPSEPASVEGKTLAAVHFYDEREGFVVTDRGQCLSTTDGGRSWGYCDEQVLQLLTPGARGIIQTTTARYAGVPALPRGLMWVTFRYTDSDDGAPTNVDFSKVKTNVNPADLPEPARNVARQLDANTVTYPGGKEMFFVGATEAWLVVRDGISHTTDGTTWEVSRISPDNALNSLVFVDRSRGWAVGDRGEVVATTDGGKTWTAQRPASESEPNLRAASFQPDGRNGWAAGDAGTVLHTDDGGATWVHQTQAQRRLPDGRLESTAGPYYFRLLPPWYYVSWVFVALLLLPVRRTALVDLEVKEPEDSVADVLVSDRPLEEGDPDTIDFKSIALGLSRFLRNENTKPPLTIAITGEWGTGKSSLMNLLRSDLRRYDFRPVWFNAWHHQKEEHLLASLLQNVRLQAVPAFWRPEGLVFRVRLLLIRGARHWGPVLLLLLFAAVAVFYELMRGGTNTYLTQAFKEFAALFYGEQTPDVSEFTKYYLSRLPLLVSVLTVGGAVWRGATAFGVNPASLMASMSRGVRVRDLDAQTSFRQRFAAEFSDVTRALGARSMIIFIDDLDRCRPENVVETLEAVNFLVSSGECFVVIGMARERVEPCVGLSFKDVAAEMLDEGGPARRAGGADGQRRRAQPAAGPDASGEEKKDPKLLQEERAREKRLEYARQYLDKLINIEVPVPVPTPAQSRGILLANARRAEEQEDKAARTPAWRRVVPKGAEALARDYWRLLLGCLAVVTLLWVCYQVAFILSRPVPVADVAQSAVANANANTNVNANSNVNANANTNTNASRGANVNANANASGFPNANNNANAFANTNASQAVPTPTPARAPDGNAKVLTPGKRSVILAAVPVFLVVLAVGWVGFWVLTRRPGLVVKDSPRFIDALTIWHPLVFACSSTPRSIKRFMNRVRYLAMRQRRQSDSPPAWQRLLRRFGASQAGRSFYGREIDALLAQRAEAAAQDGAAAGDGAAAPIPDELLVALAAIHHFKPRMFTEKKAEALLSEISAEGPSEDALAAARCEKDDWALLQDAKAEHVLKFGGWGGDKLVRARDEFIRISEGVQVN